MAHSNKFAAGKYANAICDICGIRCKYTDLRGTTVRGKATGLLACPTCWDPDHPQNFLDRYVVSDAQALRNARPDTGLDASRQLYPPGNWINGQPPSQQMQAAEMAAQKAADAKAKQLAREEQQAWLEADQATQQKGAQS